MLIGSTYFFDGAGAAGAGVAGAGAAGVGVAADGAGAAGAGAAGAGAEAGADFAGAPGAGGPGAVFFGSFENCCSTELPTGDEIVFWCIVRAMDVSMNMIAHQVVALERNVVAPRGPK